MNHGTAFYQDERCLWHTTGEVVLGGMPVGGRLAAAAGCRVATLNIRTMLYGSRSA